MNPDNLMLEELIYETKKENYFKAFLKDLQQNNAKLYAELKEQATMALNAIRSGYKPRQKVPALNYLFQLHPDLNPMIYGDTYGVKAFIVALAQNTKEAAKAKRFYDRTVDQVYKKKYEKSFYLPKYTSAVDSIENGDNNK